MMTEINTQVGLGELALSSNPNEILTAHGLGSCVGVAAYDPVYRIAGMLHIMLPEAHGSGEGTLEAKYAVTGLPLMLEKMETMGAKRENLVIKMAGGARMFSINSHGGIFNIGPRNIEIVRKIIKNKGLVISGEDVGENYGRTMMFYVANGKVMTKSVLYGYKEL